ncbi:uncharacterized protein [Palaemon carinicauda]|uniref:uncharacterized protein n=1 Tax=Palaemon carinicauda TaxID=392227 RepID=UPI0035B5FF8E
MEQELSPFDLTENIKLVPLLTENNPEDYFRIFEETANHLNWPAEQWVGLLKPKLSGKAAKDFRHLDDTKDYKQVKKAILDAFSITEDGYRQAFRNLCKLNIQTFLEFASDKLRAFKKFLKYAKVTPLEELMNLMVLEEFKRKLPINIMLYIEDRQEKDLLKAASLADTYSLIHKSIPNKRAEVFAKPVSGKSQQISDDNPKGSDNPRCSYCKKDGHTICNCKDPKCKGSDNYRNVFMKPNVKFSTSQSKPVSHVQVNVSDVFDDFKFEGIRVLGEKEQKSKVTILRDTGAALTLLHSKALPNVENNLTGEKVVVRDLIGISSSPLASVYLNCPLVKGKVELRVIDTELPVKGVSLLFGNDLAGKLIVPNLIVTDTPMDDRVVLDRPLMDDEMVDLEQAPIHIVTRSQTGEKVYDFEVDSDFLAKLMSKDKLIAAQRNTETGYGDNIVNVNVKVKDEKPEVSEPEFIYSWRFVDSCATLKDFENSSQHLSPFQSEGLENLIYSYPDLYGENSGQRTVLTHDIELLPRTAPIRISPAKKLVMKEEVEYLLRAGLAKPSKSPWASPCLLVPKEDGSMRLCTDYGRVNSATVKDSYPLPHLEDLIDSVGQAKYVAKIDLLKGYYQVKLTSRAKLISAFITPFVLFYWCVCGAGHLVEKIVGLAVVLRFEGSYVADACGTGAGGVLLQEIDGLLHPIGYTSSSFKPHQLSYSTIEKELLSLVLALQKF